MATRQQRLLLRAARRQRALERPELRRETQAFTSPAGVTSAPIKQENPEVRAAIEAALARTQAKRGASRG